MKRSVEMTPEAYQLFLKDFLKDNPVKGIEIRMIPDPVRGNDVPQILCQCGNADQALFAKYFMDKLVPDPEHKHRTKRIKMNVMKCERCDWAIPHDQFAMMAKEFAKKYKLNKKR